MKRHHLLPLLAFFICLLNSCGNAPKSSVESPQKVVIAYVTSWSEIMPNPALVTHINYAFGHVNDTFNGVRINNEERLKQKEEKKLFYHNAHNSRLECGN